jgi:hypothetical protein
MFREFLFTTSNFALYTFCALAAFINGWLIMDSIEGKVAPRYKVRYIGFWCMALYLLFQGGFDFPEVLQAGFDTLFLAGILLISIGTYEEPTPQLRIRKEKGDKSVASVFMLYRIGQWGTIGLMMPIFINFYAWAMLIVGSDIGDSWFYYKDFITLLYLLFIVLMLYIKYSIAIQRQIKGEVMGFSFIALSYLVLNINQYFLAPDIRFDQWTQLFGPLWILEKGLLVVGFGVLFKYSLGFLRYRIKPQLFVDLIAASLTIFFTVTVTFLVILINDFQKNTLFNLLASSKAIELSIVELRNDSILASKALVNNQKVLSGIFTEDRETLDGPVQDILFTSGADFIVVTNEAGLSLYETDDPSIRGVNFSNDTLMQRALSGAPVNTIVVKEGVLAPQMVATTYMPVVQSERVIGSVVVGYLIDDQLVDAIKKTTSLDVTVFAHNIRAATTFVTEDGLNKLSGTAEENQEVVETVLARGRTFEGVIKVFNREYLAIYTPLRDADGRVIGMISVGEPSRILAAVAQKSIQTTLKVMALLILISLLPTYYFIDRIAKRQLL